MRKRVRKYGTYYYLDTGEKPRKEIPLGKDYLIALKRYAELREYEDGVGHKTFGDAIVRYRTQELPKKSPNTIRVTMTDLNYLEEYFGDAPMDEIRPMHIRMFLDKHSDKPTTANRCKRVFSAVWNVSRGWGYTDLPTPTAGIRGYTLEKREIYITDEIFKMVRNHASDFVKDAMDLAYFTGQRPSDALRLTEANIVDGHLLVGQGKTRKKLRIRLQGALAALMDRIIERKRKLQAEHPELLTNERGERLTYEVLGNHFRRARTAAIKTHPQLENEIRQFWFYDLRAKAADDVGDERGAQAATDLLGHDSQRTTNRHYRRRGKIVEPAR
jgi:integrase